MASLKKIDIVTILYNDKIEIELIKLQAYSLKFVDRDIINKVYIIWNDLGECPIEDIIPFYPDYIRDNVHLKNGIDILGIEVKSSWYNQQILKILAATFVESEHYLILDGKNHFIRNVTYKDYINDDGTQKLFLSHVSPSCLVFYDNCLKYFNIKDPFNINTQYLSYTIVIHTPFVMSKLISLELINYIQDKEKTSFLNFFMSIIKSPKENHICEFYLYSTYLIFTNRLNKTMLYPTKSSKIHGISSSSESYIYENIGWASISKIESAIKNPHINCFGIHRRAPTYLSDTYKSKLLELYELFYDKDICEFIKTSILYNSE